MARKLRQALTQRSDRGALIESPLRDSPSFLVRLAQLGVFDEFYRHFAGLSMTPARFGVFALIVSNPGVRPGTLAEELRVKPSNVAGLVNSLVADGLVKRQQDKAELRANELRPTKAGLIAFKEMWEIHCTLDKLLLEPLSVSERKVFVQLMQKLDSVQLNAHLIGEPILHDASRGIIEKVKRQKRRAKMLDYAATFMEANK